jgi:hypothetical protein
MFAILGQGIERPWGPSILTGLPHGLVEVLINNPIERKNERIGPR